MGTLTLVSMSCEREKSSRTFISYRCSCLFLSSRSRGSAIHVTQYCFPSHKLQQILNMSEIVFILILSPPPNCLFTAQIWGTVRSPEGPGLKLQHPEVALLRQAAVAKGVTRAASAHVQRLVQPQAKVSTDEGGKHKTHRNQNEESDF